VSENTHTQIQERAIAIAGRGGQGVVLAATLLARAVFRKGLYVAQLQSYGAEVRGGAVVAYVVLSKQPIENPYPENYDLVIALHEAGVARRRNEILSSKVIVADEDLVKPVPKDNVVQVKIVKSGTPNMVALGIIAAFIPAITEELRKEISKLWNAEENLRSFDTGIRIGVELLGKHTKLKEIVESLTELVSS
jgi:2-oxoglutarate ferredoxin oxidoreductase subunit gamma